MRREYHCLIAGLPELFFDTTKLNSPLSEFKSYLKEELHQVDYWLIESFFWRYDNLNLLNALQKKETQPIDTANLDSKDFDTIFFLVKDDALHTFEYKVPGYIGKFITAFKNDIPIYPNLSWENQLTKLYYEFLLTLNNSFVKSWYTYELDITNILTAANGKKHQVNIETELIGDNELNEKLIRSSAKDFGLGNDFPKIDLLLRALDENDLIEKEKKTDLLKWEILNEWTFFHYFSIEKIFAYLLQLSIVERWLKLDKNTGEELFKKLLNSLEKSYEFPEEFSQK